MEGHREIFVACSKGSYDDGEDSSDGSSVCSSNSLPNSRSNSAETKSFANHLYYRKNYPKSIKDIPWYHEGMTRNAAEAVLLTSGYEGSYLLRNSSRNPGQYTISVRYSNSVKHFALTCDGETYNFGIAEFESLEDLLDHFSCLPVIGAETGGTVTLQYPYYNKIPEPHTYVKIERHAEAGRNMSSSKRSFSLPDYHIASKEGYLVKLGAFRKSWRKRWFILRRNELKYFKNKSKVNPIRTINLETAIAVKEEEIPGKLYCFLLQLPWRTFHFYASTAKEAADWITILQWKLDYYKQRNDSKISKDPLATLAR